MVPADGEYSVRDAVTVVFSEPIDPDTLTSNTFWISTGGTKVSGEILKTPAVSDPTGVSVATFRPTVGLESYTAYTATVTTEVRDLAGNPLSSPYSWSFSTYTIDDSVRPRVVSVSPLANADNVPINANIQVTFSEIMDPGSILGSVLVMRGTEKLPVTPSFDFDTVLRGTVVTLRFTDPLRYGATYSVTVTRAAKDGGGNPMQTDFHSQFTTTSVAASGGYAFLQPIKLSDAPNVVASLDVDPFGQIYALWEEGGVVRRRSVDGGQTFDPPLNVIPDGGFRPLNPTHTVSTADGILDIAAPYTVSEEQGGTLYLHSEIAYVRSTDSGVNFSPPVAISTVDDFHSQFPAVARANDLVGVAWADYIIPFSFPGVSGYNPTILFRRSLDGGQTFSPAILLSGLQTSGSMPRLAVPDSRNVHAIWNDSAVGNIMYSRSGDAGESFSAPVQLSNTQTQIWPWATEIVVETDGSIDVVWGEGVAFQQRLYLTRSTDGGVSFTPPTQLALPSVDYSCASVKVTTSGQVAVSWTVGDAAQQSGRLSYFAISDQAKNFGPPVQIPLISDTAGCPTATIDPVTPTTVHLSWGPNYSKGTFVGP